MERMKAHEDACPRCRAEMVEEEALGRRLQDSFRLAADSLVFTTEKATMAGGERSERPTLPQTANIPSSQSQSLRVLRWSSIAAGAAILLAVVVFGPLRPRQENPVSGFYSAGTKVGPHADELADPFQDWIEKRAIITIEDKSAGTTSSYMTDRSGMIRKISDRGKGR
jgi:hypothetical protein